MPVAGDRDTNILTAVYGSPFTLNGSLILEELIIFRPKTVFILTLLPISFFLFLSACEKAIEEDVIEPVEMMVGQKSAAMAQAALSNVQAVRSALMRYPAVSTDNQYPGDMDIYDYTTLRQTLADAGLPQHMVELMWDPAQGITYRSDGRSFTLEVRALSGETIVATEAGITKN